MSLFELIQRTDCQTAIRGGLLRESEAETSLLRMQLYRGTRHRRSTSSDLLEATGNNVVCIGIDRKSIDPKEA